MNMQTVIEKIKSFERFIISAYKRLDGDAVGSELAMFHLLTQMGKDVVVANQEKIPSHYQFIPGVESVYDSYEGLAKDRECMITVDCPDVRRESLLRQYWPDDLYIVNIDHHDSNYLYGDVNWIDGTAAAVGEMIFDLVKALDQPLSVEIATALYVSIVTDTGRFGFPGTTSRTHKVAVAIHEAGIDLANITREIYQSKTPGEIKLLAKAARSAQLLCKGKIAVVTLTPGDIKEAAHTPEESQPFVEVGLGMKGVWMAIFQRCHKDGRPKFSFRSKSDKIDVNVFAQKFGGGGHARAAGLILEGDFEEISAKIVAAAEEYVSKHGE
ncbi:bifunctional oligoribonuclease/PAP phosphatase NrnA [Planctomycetota bacterium]